MHRLRLYYIPERVPAIPDIGKKAVCFHETKGTKTETKTSGIPTANPKCYPLFHDLQFAYQLRKRHYHRMRSSGEQMSVWRPFPRRASEPDHSSSPAVSGRSTRLMKTRGYLPSQYRRFL